MKINAFPWGYCIIALFLLALPAIVQAQLTFTTNNGSITITGYSGPGGAVVIPNTINGFAVTGIGEEAFADSTNVTSIAIPSSVTSIGLAPFLGCANLMNIAVNATNSSFRTINGVLFDKGQDTIIAYPEGLPNTTYTFPYTVAVTSIGPYAFAYCTNLTSIDIPRYGILNSIGDFAFFGCSSLASVAITNPVANIGVAAFASCTSLANVVMANSVNSIGGLAFAYCTNLTSAYFQGNAPPDLGTAFYGDPEAIAFYLPGASGWSATFGGAPTVEETPSFEFEYATNNGSLTITGYVGPVGFVVIPDAINGCPVTSIGSQAFQGSIRVSSIVIPESVTNVGESAFAFCTNLTSVYFSSNAPPDVGNAFYGDPSAVVYYEPGTNNSVTTFGGAPAMAQTPVSDFYYSKYNGTVSISGYRDSGTFGGTVVIPPFIDGYPVTGILTHEGFGFATNVIIPDTVTYIEEEAFENSALTSIAIPNSVTYIGEDAFMGCFGLTSVTIGNGVTSIWQYMFSECTGLTNVTIPDSVNSIYESAFQNCTSLKSVVIPNSVTNLGEFAFQDCGLTNITIPDTVTSIGYGLFSQCRNLTTVTIPNSVTSIGQNAFYDCASLSSIAIPGSVAGIGQAAFFGCGSLPSVAIPDGVTNIGVWEFQNCSSLTNIIIPDTVISIGNGAFYQCSSLPSVNVPASVASIAQGSFASCASLTNISVAAANPAYSSTSGILFDKAYDTLVQYPAGLTNSAYAIPDGVNTVGGNAFSACDSLITVTIPNSVTNINDDTFYDCASLASITIPAGVTNIGAYALYDCTNLTSITFPDSVASIGDDAFQGCIGLTSGYFQGNAPPDDGTIFSGDSNTVYFLSGTTGWGTTFGGVPTELWNPQATNLITSGGQFNFNITGPTNLAIVVEACTNLANPVWLPVSTNTLSASGMAFFSDPQRTIFPSRYYRFSAP